MFCCILLGNEEMERVTDEKAIGIEETQQEHLRWD